MESDWLLLSRYCYEYIPTIYESRSWQVLKSGKMLLVKVVAIFSFGVEIFAFESKGPPLPQSNFIPIWNAPTDVCKSKWDIDLNLSKYGIVHNVHQMFHGEYINIFNDKLGLWPYFADNGTVINKGLPQLGDLNAHLQKVVDDIQMFIPDEDYQGIAIIDWEKWRPVYDRNWDHLSIYRNQSMELVQKQHPSWTKQQIETEARKEFEAAAMNYMLGTILAARRTHPKALWGYYGFPRCYNSKLTTYNCSQKTMKQNDQLFWLFNSSTVIFPSIYLSPKLHYNKTNYAKGNILEAFRVAQISIGRHIPVFPYVRIVYALSEIFLNEEDMYATITQSAELASSGIVIWGSSRDKKKEFCIQMSIYIAEFFGPLVQTLNKIAQDCGNQYCTSSHGRCRFKLDSVNSYDKHVLMGLKDKWTFLECVCKDGWMGKACEKSML